MKLICHVGSRDAPILDPQFVFETFIAESVSKTALDWIVHSHNTNAAKVFYINYIDYSDDFKSSTMSRFEKYNYTRAKASLAYQQRWSLPSAPIR